MPMALLWMHIFEVGKDGKEKPMKGRDRLLPEKRREDFSGTHELMEGRRRRDHGKMGNRKGKRRLRVPLLIFLGPPDLFLTLSDLSFHNGQNLALKAILRL